MLLQGVKRFFACVCLVTCKSTRPSRPGTVFVVVANTLSIVPHSAPPGPFRALAMDDLEQ
jgi:hypothetical protein